jgi:hypothetical protein
MGFSKHVLKMSLQVTACEIQEIRLLELCKKLNLVAINLINFGFLSIFIMEK